MYDFFSLVASQVFWVLILKAPNWQFRFNYAAKNQNEVNFFSVALSNWKCVLSTKVKQSNISCTIVPVAIKDLVYNIPNGKTHLQDTCIFKQLYQHSTVRLVIKPPPSLLSCTDFNFLKWEKNQDVESKRTALLELSLLLKRKYNRESVYTERWLNAGIVKSGYSFFFLAGWKEQLVLYYHFPFHEAARWEMDGWHVKLVYL